MKELKELKEYNIPANYDDYEKFIDRIYEMNHKSSDYKTVSILSRTSSKIHKHNKIVGYSINEDRFTLIQKDYIGITLYSFTIGYNDITNIKNTYYR